MRKNVVTGVNGRDGQGRGGPGQIRRSASLLREIVSNGRPGCSPSGGWDVLRAAFRETEHIPRRIAGRFGGPSAGSAKSDWDRDRNIRIAAASFSNSSRCADAGVL